jgi:adenylate kinase family enzyme
LHNGSVLLGPDDLLPTRAQRIVVAGGSGAGKSTLARDLADGLGLPYTEIDSLYHGPGWTERASFVDDVRAFAAGERWVCEWQYDVARPILLARCDLLVWLDLPRRVTTWRVVRRTVRRRLRREVLWNGNREGSLWRILVDREQIIRWAWTSHPRAAQRVAAAQAEQPDLPVVRLRSSTEVDRWLARLRRPGGTPARPR